MITETQKQKIADAMKEARANYPSNAKFAQSIGLSPSSYTRIVSGNLSVVSDSSWVTIARKLRVSLRDEMEWHAAPTPTYQFVCAQLEMCQSSALSAILCDAPNIGKTFAARQYVSTHKNCVYVDCSQVKTKCKLVKKISQEFGLDGKGNYGDMYEDLVYYMSTLESPMVILDEAGDLQYEAFLELKALWNATERRCAWYMMGADGLKAKINRNIECQKVGFTEMLSRYGDRYSRVTPDDGKEREQFHRAQATMVAKANAPAGADVQQIVRKSGGGLRRVYTEIEKLRMSGVCATESSVQP